jgi:hypothetical protein
VTPQEISDRYFAAMRAQDLEALLALFAADGEIVWPNGTRLVGQDAIRQAYAGMFQRPGNNPAPGPLMIGPGCFSTEVLSRLPDGSERRTINVFTFGDDGLVTRMDSYRQG